MLRRGYFAISVAAFMAIVLFATISPAPAQQVAPPLHAAWEGNWDGNGAYWSVMTVKVKGSDAEVVYAFAGAPVYYTKVKTDGTNLAFKWGNAAFEFTVTPDGKTLQGTRRFPQGTNSIAMTRMF